MDLEPVLPAIGTASVPSLAIGLALWWLDRRDKNRTAGMTQEQSQRDSLEKLYSGLTSQQALYVKQLSDQLTIVTKNRDRGWDLARYWHGAFNDLLQVFKSLRHEAAGMTMWIAGALLRLPEVPKPDFAPIPEIPKYPMGLEDPKQKDPSDAS